MFDRIRMWVQPVPRPVLKPPGMSPGSAARYKAWVVLEDGRVAYIDHYKSDGRFGVRPVDFASGRHYPNTSEHWTTAERHAYPEELALTLRDFRVAERDEIPAPYRGLNG